MRQARNRKTSFVFALPVALLALLCVDCAMKEREWTAFEPRTSVWTHEIPGSSEPVAANTIGRRRMDEHVNNGCISCHEGAHDPHHRDGILDTQAGCVDCHGGDGSVVWDGSDSSLASTTSAAHPAPRYPERWNGSANPERSYTLLNVESPEWIRFVNPGDLRVAAQTCAPCHTDHVINVSKSLMATSAHFWGAAGYCNGIVSNKRSIFGESHSPEGIAQKINGTVRLKDDAGWRWPTPQEVEQHSISSFVVPLPHWEVTQTGNIYRIFERGSRLGTTALGLNGLPVPLIGLPDKLEDPGRPNNRMSDRGLGTLNRVDLPLLNVHKTRLNDPHLGFLGTNDQPGDYRSSGCTACHMVYANDRNPIHSGPYAVHGHLGKAAASDDPMIREDDKSGHPIDHQFTSGIPSSQCMVCHMHQPNSFLNTYYGYQMWSYETDGAPMWPEEEQYPSNNEWFQRIDRNPEEAAIRGNWGDRDFLDNVTDLNPQLRHTQFADYHGHGWIFRGVFKTDRKGNLIDSDGNQIDYSDPSKFEGVVPNLGQLPALEGDMNASMDTRLANGHRLREAFGPKPGKAVHLKDIHAEVGMHCVDCHFSQDVHNNGLIYSEYQAAVQITCQDCHGTAEKAIDEYIGSDRSQFETWSDDDFFAEVTGGPASQLPADMAVGMGQETPHELTAGETPWGKPRFQKVDGKIVQNSMLYENVSWVVGQIATGAESRLSEDADGNEKDWSKADYAHYQMKDGELVHGPGNMDCASCHTSWVTSCFGCHLPQKANWRTAMHHFEDKNLRNLASYNPQVARDDAFMLGISGDVKDNRVAVVRSSSAVMISSEDAQRRIVYKQLTPMAANGMSSQAFNTHFAHTVRTKETRGCADCHLAEGDENNAWLAQVTLMGTGNVNFMGMHAYVATGTAGFEAVNVTEWDEPQAVIGSRLHEMVYPDRFQDHLGNGGMLQKSEYHGGKGGEVRSIALRGEYLFTASGSDGFRIYDVANVANKDFSEKMVTSPVSPLGQDTHIPTTNATGVALPFNNLIHMGREWRPENAEQMYVYDGKPQNMHESYRYAYVCDSVEGLVVVDVDCLNDGDPDNNFIEKVVAWNEGGILNGATSIWVAGETALITADAGLVAVDINDPRRPRLLGSSPLDGASSVTVQFQYAFVTDAEGLKTFDIMGLLAPKGAVDDEGQAYRDENGKAIDPIRPAGSLAISDARHVYVARTYAYVSAGAAGMVIVDVERPGSLSQVMTYNADGKIRDLHQIQVGAVNDSFYAFLADGDAGFHVVSLVTPEDDGGTERSAYGYAPEPRPTWVSSYRTRGPALAVHRGLDRDRAVDESGNQTTIFGRIGGRPFNRAEMQDLLFINQDGQTIPHRPAATPPEGWTPPARRPRSDAAETN